MERRREQRIALRLRCLLITNPTLPGRHRGLTENVSRFGALVRLTGGARHATALDPADHVELHLELPARSKGSPPRAIQCMATVAWCDVTPEGDGLVAVNVLRMQFCDPPTDLRSMEHSALPPQIVM